MTPRRNVPLGQRPILAVIILAIALFQGGCASSSKTTVKTTTDQSAYAFWPPYPDDPRIQFLVGYQHSGQIAEATRNAMADIVYGKEFSADVAINKPYGVEMWNGRIYTCDIRGGEVMVFDLRQKQTRVMGTTGHTILAKPTDIAVADDGTKYVADIGRNQVFVFSPDERFITTYAVKDMEPAGVAVYNERLYVTDFGNQCVQIFNRFDGKIIGKFGSRGDEDGLFVRPLGVDVDKDGNIWTTDVIRCRIQQFSPSGELLNAFGIIGNNIGALVRPKHVAVDDDENVFIVDSAFQNAQIFAPDGDILTFFGAAGPHIGSMYLPVGIAIHHGDLDLFQQYVHPDFQLQYLILVTNQFGDRKVSVYGFGNLRPGVTVDDIRASQADINLGVEDADKVNVPVVGPDQPEPDQPDQPN